MNLYNLTGQSLELLKMIEDGDCTQEQLAGALKEHKKEYMDMEKDGEI